MATIREHGLRYGLMLATALCAAMWAGAGSAYTPDQQQACTPDAFRLCGSAIPDVDRVTACMIRNKAQLSPPCRAFFRGGKEPRPRASTASSTRKGAKPHKRKKSTST